MKCTVCKVEGTTLYHFWLFDLCPKCHGIFRDAKTPSYIPHKQGFKYKLEVTKRKYGKREKM